MKRIEGKKTKKTRYFKSASGRGYIVFLFILVFHLLARSFEPDMEGIRGRRRGGRGHTGWLFFSSFPFLDHSGWKRNNRHEARMLDDDGEWYTGTLLP